MRPHYARRFASSPFETRTETDMLISSAKFAEMGTAAAHIVVQDLPGYPKVSAPDDASYRSTWV
jgi:hypothetical protein